MKLEDMKIDDVIICISPRGELREGLFYRVGKPVYGTDCVEIYDLIGEYVGAFYPHRFEPVNIEPVNRVTSVLEVMEEKVFDPTKVDWFAINKEFACGI